MYISIVITYSHIIAIVLFIQLFLSIIITNRHTIVVVHVFRMGYDIKGL